MIKSIKNKSLNNIEIFDKMKKCACMHQKLYSYKNNELITKQIYGDNLISRDRCWNSNLVD